MADATRPMDRGKVGHVGGRNSVQLREGVPQVSNRSGRGIAEEGTEVGLTPHAVMEMALATLASLERVASRGAFFVA